MEIAPSLSYEICLWHSWNFRNLGTCMLSHFSRVQLFVTLRTVAHQAPLSMGFSRQEYWSWLPFPPPGVLPNPRIEPTSLLSPSLAGEFFTTRVTWETPRLIQRITISPFFLKVAEVGDMKVVPIGEAHNTGIRKPYRTFNLCGKCGSWQTLTQETLPRDLCSSPCGWEAAGFSSIPPLLQMGVNVIWPPRQPALKASQWGRMMT